MGEGKWDMGRRSGPELLTMVGLCGFLERWRKGCYSLPHRVVFGGEEELESITINQRCPAKAQLPWCHQLIPYHWLLPQHRSSEALWDFLQDYVLPPLPLVHTWGPLSCPGPSAGTKCLLESAKVPGNHNSAIHLGRLGLRHMYCQGSIKLSLSAKAWDPFPFVFQGRDLQPEL